MVGRHFAFLFAVFPPLASCGEPVDPEDVRFFTEGEPYVPDGLLCGFAYAGGKGDHRGASCLGAYDPALQIMTTEKQVVAESWNTGVRRNVDYACPDLYTTLDVNDRDSPDSSRYGNGGWASCIAQGNKASSSGDLRDLPQGAVCGLSSPSSLDNGGWAAPCEGTNPSVTGKCPEGYVLRWVIDAFWDHVDLTNCLPDENGDNTFGADPLIYCEVAEGSGCDEGSCLDAEVYQGTMCGLHLRGTLGEYQFSQDPSAWQAPEEHPYGKAVYDEITQSWFNLCSPFDDALGVLAPVLEANVADYPSCMGKDISSGECPVGWELACAPGWSASEPEVAVYTALCWCTPSGGRQIDLDPDTGE